MVDGKDSGEPSPKTKLHVAFNSGGKCCFPNCLKHLTLEGTNIGECAHIIPRKVGFVREDWKTPLADRKKPANLIYVCSEHHLVIDDLDNSDKYLASDLIAWKAKHEAWVLCRNKDTPSIPETVRKRLEETMASLDRDLAGEVSISRQLLARLLADCKVLLRRWCLGKVEVLLSQAEILLSDFDDLNLNAELQALQANFLWKQGKIPEAKAKYLRLLESSDYVEGMLDYIDLCYSAPEDGDKASEYEEKIERIAPDDPRLKIIKLRRQYQRQEKLETEIKEEKWSDDDWLNGQFYLVYALFFDLANDLKNRDHFIDQWEKLFPDSARPNLFRTLFMTVDAYRKGIENHSDALTLLGRVQAQEQVIYSNGKDPLSPHDRISLLVEKIKSYSAILHFSGRGLEELAKTRDELFALVNGSYFDTHIDRALLVVLCTVVLDLPQWKGLVAAILASRVVPSADLIDRVFLQGLKLAVDTVDTPGIRQVIAAYSRNDLSDLLDAVEQKTVHEILRAIDGKEEKFKLLLLQSINDPNLRVELVQNIESPEASGVDTRFIQLEAVEASGNDKEAVRLAKQVKLEDVNPAFLGLINHVAYKYGEQKLVIESGERILSFDLPAEYTTDLHGKLAVAYSRSDDHRNAYKHAAEALKYPDLLGKENTRTLVLISVNSLLTLDKNDEAAEFIESYSGYSNLIHETPVLGIFFADAVLKSAHDDKVSRAIEYVTQAFRSAPSSEEKLYLSAFLVLNELRNLGAISLESMNAVEDGHFVKINGIGDTWFYTGEESDAFGATAINGTDPRYMAIIGKSPAKILDWPADRYSSSKIAKTIALILDRNGYFFAKSGEVMRAMVERGHEAIWRVEVLNEDGTLNKENLTKFHQEQFRNQYEFFKQFCENPLPFGMLCSVEGSLQQAISRICSESKGFIRCNNGTAQHLQDQYQVAEQIISGSSFFIDSLAALMLCESDMLTTIVEKLPNIHVATSVIGTLRDIAEDFRTGSSSAGRMGFAGGQLRVTERKKESEAQFRQKIIFAADLLDNLPNRVIGNGYEADAEDTEFNLDKGLPRWIVDTVRLAQEKECVVVTDDALSLQAYAVKEGAAPPNTSSLSLIRCLHDNGTITWEEYLQYFRLLSSYRYYLLPISVEDMERTVLRPSSSGLVLFTPKNIDYLHLSLTLANEYGVEDKTAIRITTLFLSRILLRNDVTENMAEEIFPLVLLGALAKREANVWGRVIVNLCEKILRDDPVSSALAHRKLSLLERHVMRYVRQFDPIIKSVPSLLKLLICPFV